MDFDFSFFLFSATVVTGIIWWGYLYYLKRNNRQYIEANEPLIVEYARSFFPVVLIVFILRSFIAEPFRIPSGSMMPTLLIGDFILVNKFTYGIRLPVINKKIIDINEPQRGDAMVFRYPKNPTVDYIKRVIGLPGDRISYINKKLTINDIPMKQVSLGRYQGVGQGKSMTGSELVTEDLQSVANNKKTLKWFWESSHFKKEVGDIMLDQVLGCKKNNSSVYNNFGIKITIENIENHLKNIRRGRLQWRENSFIDYSEIHEMLL